MSDDRVVSQLDFSGKRHIGVTLILLSAFLYSPVGVFSKGVDADSWSIIFWRGALAAPAGIFYLMVIGKLGGEWQPAAAQRAIQPAVDYTSGLCHRGFHCFLQADIGGECRADLGRVACHCGADRLAFAA